MIEKNINKMIKWFFSEQFFVTTAFLEETVFSYFSFLFSCKKVGWCQNLTSTILELKWWIVRQIFHTLSMAPWFDPFVRSPIFERKKKEEKKNIFETTHYVLGDINFVFLVLAFSVLYSSCILLSTINNTAIHINAVQLDEGIWNSIYYQILKLFHLFGNDKRISHFDV